MLPGILLLPLLLKHAFPIHMGEISLCRFPATGADALATADRHLGGHNIVLTLPRKLLHQVSHSAARAENNQTAHAELPFMKGLSRQNGQLQGPEMQQACKEACIAMLHNRDQLVLYVSRLYLDCLSKDNLALPPGIHLCIVIAA